MAELPEDTPADPSPDSTILRLRRSERRARWIAAVAVVVAVVAVALALTGVLSRGSGGDGGSNTAALERATVYITGEEADGTLDYSGSGAIVRKDGLILTNAHVGAPKAPGLDLEYGRGTTADPPPARLVVWLFRSEDEAPKRMYVAKAIASDGYADVAVLKIVKTVKGKPVDPRTLRLPTVPIGDSNKVSGGQPLTIVGYPGTGGDTINISKGTVSGFLPDPRLHTGRAWIKTDAQINAGNSGGIAADSNGRMVGITSASQCGESGDACEGESLSIDAALPILRAAEAGKPWHSPYFVWANGKERFVFLGWAANAPDDSCAFHKVTSYGSGASEIYAVFDATHVAPKEDVEYEWNGPDGPDTYDYRWDGTRDELCYWYQYEPDGDGRYSLKVFAGPTLQPVGRATPVVVGG